MATVSGRSPERCRRTESGRHNAPRGGQLQHSRGRTRDHGTPPAMQSCFGSASDAMLGAICRTTVDAPLCAELLKMDLSAQALWQEKHTFSLTKSQYLVECSRARQDVLVRSGHGAGRARMRVPTCSARPAPRYAVLYRFHFSARRAPARGVGDFVFGNQSGVLHRTPTGRLGALYRAPIRGPGRLYYPRRDIESRAMTAKRDLLRLVRAVASPPDKDTALSSAIHALGGLARVIV